MKEAFTLRTTLLVMALVASLVACQSAEVAVQQLYSGEARPEREVSRIDLDENARIVGFDGYRVPRPRSAVFLPGRHKLVIYRVGACNYHKWSTSGGGDAAGVVNAIAFPFWLGCMAVADGPKCLIFNINARAGREYEYVEVGDHHWLVDASTSQRIAEASQVVTVGHFHWDGWGDLEICKDEVGNDSYLPGWEAANASIIENQIKSPILPSSSQEISPQNSCSDAEFPEKPWVGKWVARLDNAVLTFEIEEEVIRGDLKSGSRDFSIVGKVNNEGALSAAIFGKNSFDRMNAHGTFPHLKLSYPYGTPQSPVFKVLDGQTLRLCS